MRQGSWAPGSGPGRGEERSERCIGPPQDGPRAHAASSSAAIGRQERARAAGDQAHRPETRRGRARGGGHAKHKRQEAIISRVLSPRTVSLRTSAGVAAIHLLGGLLRRSSSQPGSLGAKHAYPSCERRETPIRPCSGWGLPCGCRCRPPGALLPHPFTLACPPTPEEARAIGGLLSVALSLAPPKGRRRALPATLVSWSPDFPRAQKHAAASGPLTRAAIGASHRKS